MRKLKAILFVALLMLCTATSYAQSKWGVFGQANLSGSTADGVGTRVGGSLGVMYDRKLFGNLYLQPRLVASYQENETKKGVKPNQFFSQWALTLPVLASYKIDLGSDNSLRLNAGPYLQYATFGRDRVYAQHTGETQGHPALGWWHLDFGKHFTYGVQGGVSFTHKKWVGMIDYKYSLRKSVLNMNGHESTFSLGVGYMF